MRYRIVIQARARRTPGTKDKPFDDVVAVIETQTLLTATDASAEVVDGLTWLQFAYNESLVWIAQFSASGTPILLLEDRRYSEQYNMAFAFVLRFEGGLSDVAGDAGGLTKYGISQRAYPALDIRSLTVAQAQELYYYDYWLTAGCESLSPATAIQHFDMAVNSGIYRANQILKDSQGDPERYAQLREETYRSFKQYEMFGAGWSRRAMECLALAKTL